MVHALSADMMEYVINSSDQAPAFVLADQGYDVWLGNNRGTRWSMGHVSKDPSEKAYWDWYQEDLGRQDVPTFIDYILDTTGRQTLSYVGHSQGTTQFFLGASLLPEYYT